MKTSRVRTLRDIYNTSRKWIVKGKDTPLDVELKLTLDEATDLVTVEVLGVNIIDKDDCPSLFDKGDLDGKD